MRTLIFVTLLLFSFTLVGCKKKDNRPPLVRVNELLRNKHLPEALFIDSLFGYADVEKSIRWGEKTSYLRDNLLILSRQRELTTKEKDELRSWTSVSLSMFKQAEKDFEDVEIIKKYLVLPSK